MELNDWGAAPVARRESILNFDFLSDRGYIEEIEDGYYCLVCDPKTAELELCRKRTQELAEELGIKDVGLEIKRFIAKLHLYNELKDIAQTLLGKVADARRTTLKDVYEEFDVPED